MIWRKSSGQNGSRTRLSHSSKASSTLKMQGTSFLVAWMTSEASTELTEKASSLEHRQAQSGAKTPPAASPFTHLRSSTRLATTPG